MKAKYTIGIISGLMLSAITAKAQYSDDSYYGNDGAQVIINNYYDDYDFYYSSRINRFHRSFVAFDYYSPVFTDTYWYTYTPFTWGLSIYGGGFGLGIGYNPFPVFYMTSIIPDYGWYNPFYHGYYWNYRPYYTAAYYWGYDPFFYSYWYQPYSYRFDFGWPSYYCGGYNHHYYNHYHGWDYNRPVYYSHQDNHNINYRDDGHNSVTRNNLSSQSRRNPVGSDIRQDQIASTGRRSYSVRPENLTASQRNNENRSAVNNQNETRRSNSLNVEQRSGGATKSSVTRRTYSNSSQNLAANRQTENRSVPGKTAATHRNTNFQASSDERNVNRSAPANSRLNDRAGFQRSNDQRQQTNSRTYVPATKAEIPDPGRRSFSSATPSGSRVNSETQISHERRAPSLNSNKSDTRIASIQPSSRPSSGRESVMQRNNSSHNPETRLPETKSSMPGNSQRRNR